MTPCPTPEQLRQLLGEQLSGADRDRVESHVEACRTCQQALEELNDSFPAGGGPQTPDAGRPGDGSGGAFLRRLAAVSPDSPDVAVGGLLGDFRIVRQVGRGGMGVVYEAEQLSLGRRVALKVLPFAATLDARHLQRFHNEAQAAAGLHHEHIVPVHAVGCDRGVHFYAMQLIEGQSLAALIQRLRRSAGREATDAASTDISATPAGADPQATGPYQPPGDADDGVADAAPASAPRGEAHFRTAARLARQAAEALEHAHQQGVIHRDIKPANLLLDTRGELWVADFGLAHCQRQAALTVTGDLVGTLRYMSPEQALARPGLIDQRTDVYSLGVTLYELLTLQPAFGGRDREELLRQIAFEEPPRPRRINRAIPAELEVIALKAMAREPSERYGTAQELADDLGRYLNDEPIRARPPGLLQRARKWTRRHRAATWALAVVAVVCLLAAGSLWYEHYQRRGSVAQKVRESLAAARTALAGNELRTARQELALAEAAIAADRVALAGLAEEVDALAAELSRFEEFFQLIEQGRDAEVSTPAALAIATVTLPVRGAPGLSRTFFLDRHRGDPARAVPFFLEALSRYEVLERDDWCTALQSGALSPEQVTRVRRAAYEVLLWLANDTGLRQVDHGPGRATLSHESAARQGWTYLARAEQAWTPTPAFYRLRARCRENYVPRLPILRPPEVQEDDRLAWQTPATMAVDHYLLGQAAYLAGNRAAAVKHLEAALRLEPTHYWSLLWLGDCLCDLGKGPEDFAAAVGLHTGCIAQRPGNANAYLSRGNAYVKWGRYPEALADYSRAIELERSYAKAWSNRGALYFNNLRQLDKALPDFTRAIELDPEFPAVWANRGWAYARLGRGKEALADCSRAIKLDPGLQAAWTNRGLTHFQLGQYEQALADFSRAIQLNPSDTESLIGRGLAYHKLRQYDKAVADHSQAITVNQRFPLAWTCRGLAYRDLGQLDKAIADYSQAIALEPSNAHSFENRGDAYKRLGRYDKAVADFQRAVELDAKDGDAWLGLGAAYSALEQLDRAAPAIRRALDLQPNSAEAHFYQGAILLRQQKPAEAEKALREAVRLHKDFPDAHYNLGTALGMQGKLSDAATAYRQAIQLRPSFADSHDALGNTLYALGKHAEAETAFREAVRLRPKSPTTHYQLGNTLLDQGKHAAAEAAFREAIRQKPDFAEAHCNLGHALRRQGRFAESLAALKRGHELGSRQPGWPYPSEQWLREAGHLVALDTALSRIERGTMKLTGGRENLGLAGFCQLFKKHFAAAARFYEQAFAAEPKLAEDLKHGYRYNAACVAALAAAGKGEDASKVDDKERARLRGQALGWLRADLAAHGKRADGPAEDRAAVRQVLRHWQEDADLAGVRGEALGNLPAAERPAWRQLWADVEYLLRETSPTDAKKK